MEVEETNLDKEILEKWKKKRKLTRILAMIHAAIYGLEYTAISISALYYFQNTLHVKNPTLFYSLTIGAMFTSATFSSVILGKYMDVNRNARLVVFVTVPLAVMGNFMYCLPYSPWLPVAGRLLCGFSDAILPVMTGEFTRCYRESEINSILSAYHLIYLSSYMLGSCTPLLFQSVDIHWVIRIDQNVSIGLFLTFVQIVFAIFAYFGLYNLSTEPGYCLFLKEKLKDSEERTTDVEFEDTNNEQIPVKNEKNTCMQSNNLLKEKKDLITYKEVFTDIDCVLIIFSSSLSSLLVCLVELQTNMFSLYKLNWTLDRLSGATLFAVITCVVGTVISIKKLYKHPWTIYYFYVICFILAWIVMCLFMLMDAMEIKNTNMQLEMATVILTLSLNMFSAFGIIGFGRYLMFALVPSHSSSYCEGLRNSISRIFCGIAYYLAAPTFPYLFSLYTVLILVIILLCCLFYTRRSSFS